LDQYLIMQVELRWVNCQRSAHTYWYLIQGIRLQQLEKVLLSLQQR
jgi:hypothetical protein